MFNQSIWNTARRLQQALWICAGTFSVLTPMAHADAQTHAKQIILRVGSVAPEGTPWQRQIARTEERIESLTNNAIKMKVYLGGRKGNEKSLVRQARDGRLELVGVSAAALASEVPALQLLELPFLFESTEEADFVLDQYLRKPVANILEQHGFVLAQWAENGWQNFAMKERFIKKPNDLNGIKVRSQESPLHLMTWRTFGASPTELAVSEVSSALSTGMVDGFAQTPLFMFATGWYQSVKHYTISRHVYQPAMMVYSKKWFDKQPATIQKALLANEKEETFIGRQEVRAIEQPLVDNLKAAGLDVYTLNPKERAQFVKAAQKVHKDYFAGAPKGALTLMQAIRKGKAAYRARQ